MGDELVIKPLTPQTWDAFADLVERHNGIFSAAGDPLPDYGLTCILNSFLCSSSRATFEQHGFTYVRPKGQGHTVMRRTVAPA